VHTWILYHVLKDERRFLLVVIPIAALIIVATPLLVRMCDARAPRWPWPVRWFYLNIKWILVVFGAVGLVGRYIEIWGWQATAWFLLAPFAQGVWRAWPTHRPPSTPESH
jgi:hypothetical protein